MRDPCQSAMTLSDHDYNKMQSGPDNERLRLSGWIDDDGVDLPPEDDEVTA
jgi:hypothetical protein